MRKLALALALLPLPAFAQSDDRSYLTALIEDNLSGAGRQVVITGFAGALSSRATIEQLTIADETGVWLTLRDVALDWNRTALFSGALSVNELVAGEIVLERLPDAGEEMPSPEASAGFALPELPVSVDIGRIAAERIELGPTVLGSALVGRLEAKANLAAGEGAAELLLERTDDGPEGRVQLAASYGNATQRLVLDLSATEGAGGIAVTLMGLPGAPASTLEIKGDGPVSDYAADLRLTTNGVDRLAGKVTVKAEADGATAFGADVGGNLAPLFLPDYAAFFGERVALLVTGQRTADGRLDLSRLAVDSQALDLTGSLMLGADGMPLAFDLTGRIADAGGQPVLLPLTTDLPVRIDSADLTLAFDAAQGEGWRLAADVTGLDRPDFRASRIALTGSGRIAQDAQGRRVGATLRFDAEGLSATDPALARALGPFVSGDAVISWSEAGRALNIGRLALTGEDYSATATAQIAGLDSDLTVSGRVSADMADLSRLSGLAGRPLTGAGRVAVRGSYSPLTGALDTVAEVDGTGLSAGIAELDGLMRGAVRAEASLRRDEGGTVLRDLSLVAGPLSLTGQGRLATDGNDVTADLVMSDLSALGGGFGGALRGTARLTGTAEAARITLDATGQGLRIGQGEADTLLRGETKLLVGLGIQDGVIRLEGLDLANPQVTAKATGTLTEGSQLLQAEARLANLALILPQFPGALGVQGTIRQDAAGVTLDLRGTGPGGIDATVKGTLAPDFSRGDLAVNGQAQAALANAFIEPRAVQGGVGFDLRLNGPLALSSLSGSVSLAGGRVSDPGLKFALQDVTARADLAGGRATLRATLPVSTGGTVEVAGTAGMAAPYAGDLAIGLRGVTLRDPELYETRLNGDLTLRGPLTGGAEIAGRIALAETELRVPSTGFGGVASIEGLRHLYDSADVRATRARARLDTSAATGGDGGGAAYGLDVTISAPNQVFVRGRGLDAELGGELRLMGTTTAVVPSGGFELIRGRLDILGKRLDLTTASLLMEGELVPQLEIVAETQSDGITTGITIDGAATNPVVGFSSSPDMPDEEILAQLLFGQDLTSLSAFQALQLASAVATLAGRGGQGIVSRLREGFGLDNLDVQTSTDGGAEVTAGKYLGKNLYSELSVSQDGTSEINLNLDVTPSVTLRGRAASDGTAGIGVYLEKDY